MSPAWPRGGASLAAAALAAGCASVAKVANFDDAACGAAFVDAMTAVLVAQAEAPESAVRLARGAAATLASTDFGPRPFLVASPAGTDYAFFVERTEGACLLRLNGRQKGFVSYTNNLTYIATQPLAPCRCAE